MYIQLLVVRCPHKVKSDQRLLLGSWVQYSALVKKKFSHKRNVVKARGKHSKDV